jgi:hypothetical protein
MDSWPCASALERRATRKAAPLRDGRLEPRARPPSMPSGAGGAQLGDAGVARWPTGRAQPRPTGG